MLARRTTIQLCSMPPRQQFHIYVDEISKADTYFGVCAILCEDKAAVKGKGRGRGAVP